MKPNEHIRQELKELGSQLKDIPSNTPYKVPEGYFDGLAERIISSVKAEIDISVSTQQISKVIRMNPRLRLLKLSVAASIIGFIGISIFFLIRNTHKSSVQTNQKYIQTEKQFNDQLAMLEPGEIVDYLTTYALLEEHDDLEYFIDSNNLPEEGDYFDEDILNDLLNNGNKN